MKQLVSILIPAFNAEKWLSLSLQSAVDQTWLRKEVIVVDDGSKDATLEIANNFVSPAVKVVSQRNRGASAARNKALSLAQGDYIQWLDADDILARDKVERQMVGADPGHSSMTLLSCAWGKFCIDWKSATFAADSLWEDLEPVEWLFRKVEQNLWMAIETWLVSRKLTEMSGAWNERLSLDDDGEYFARVVSNSEKIRFVPEAKVYVRRGNIGISSTLSMNNRKLDSAAASIFNYVNQLLSMEESARTKRACLLMLERWAIYFYPERMDIFDKMKSLAAELDGELQIPRLRPKYRWAQVLFGFRIGKKFQLTLPSLRNYAATKALGIKSRLPI